MCNICSIFTLKCGLLEGILRVLVFIESSFESSFELLKI